MENQKKTTNSLARRMGISLICGLAAGLLLMMLRENLNSSGQEAVWKTINRISQPQARKKTWDFFISWASCSSARCSL